MQKTISNAKTIIPMQKQTNKKLLAIKLLTIKMYQVK